MIALKDTLTILQLIVTSGTFIGMIYALYKFTRKPGEDINERLVKIETRLDDTERSLNTNWEQTRKQQSMLEDIQMCILYLLDYEVAYCAYASKKEGSEEIDTTDLDEARKIIRQRLKQ